MSTQKHKEWLANRERDTFFSEDTKVRTYSSKDNEVFNDKEHFTANVNSMNDNVTVSTTQSSISNDVTPAITRKPRQKYSPHWTTWSNWSECTRSCGTGVMSQQRKCVTR